MRSLVSETASLLRGRFLPVVLTAAVALVPAHLLGGGVVSFALARVGPPSSEPRSPGEGAEDRRRELRERMEKGRVSGDDAPDVRRGLLRDALSGAAGEARARGDLFRLAVALTLAAAIVIVGLLFAQAAVTVVAAGTAGSPSAAWAAVAAGTAGSPSAAWAAVAARLGPVSAAAALTTLALCAGLASCLLPGLILGVGLSLAVPAAMNEGASGTAALQRSWKLVAAVWPQELALIVLSAGIAALVRWLVGRSIPEHLLVARPLAGALAQTVALAFPLTASVILYFRARDTLEAATRS